MSERFLNRFRKNGRFFENFQGRNLRALQISPIKLIQIEFRELPT